MGTEPFVREFDEMRKMRKMRELHDNNRSIEILALDSDGYSICARRISIFHRSTTEKAEKIMRNAAIFRR